MASKAGHTFTAGPWAVFVGNANGRGLVRVEADLTSDDAGEHICSFPRGSKGEAHAALVAEAGTVAHETGLTPRQLAKQRDELLEALRGTEEAIDGWRQRLSASDLRLLSEDERGILEISHSAIRAAIAKATDGGAV